MKRRHFVITLAILAVSAQDDFFTKDKETALGARLATEIRERTTSIESTAVENYIVRVGRRLATQLTDRGVTRTFTPVLDPPKGRTLEPIAFPGGFIFVSAPLILEARNESEFAGMLAHAMVHVSERHWVRTEPPAGVQHVDSVPLILVGGWGDDVLLPVGFLKSHRAFELEADRIAVRIMDGAGYDPCALLNYIDRLQPASTDRPSARSSMPSHDERIAVLTEAIQALPSATYSSSDEEFQQIQQEVRRLMPVRTDEPPTLRRPPSLIRQ